jgi:hypothetical protein
MAGCIVKMQWLDTKGVTTLANTEMQYVKNRIQKLEKDFAAFASLLIQAGIVEVKEEDGIQVYAVNKVALDG